MTDALYETENKQIRDTEYAFRNNDIAQSSGYVMLFFGYRGIVFITGAESGVKFKQ
jgi:hypothetical protein